MFSGIVETIGTIKSIAIENGCQHMAIQHQAHFNDLSIGDSIAVNGVCLTITALSTNEFTVTAVPETLRCTNVQFLSEGSAVNLERSLLASTRIGGHFVQGHVDAIGVITKIEADNALALMVSIEAPKSLMKYIVKKGYITLDGMSMTIVETSDTWFQVTIIPHTQEASIAKYYTINSKINLEVDIFGKYIEKLVGVYQHGDIPLS